MTNLQLLGLSKKEIREKIIEENLFQCRSEAAIKDLFPRVYKRTQFFNDDIRKHLVNATRPDLNALLVFAFCKTFRFPEEMVYEVVVYHYQMLKTEVTEGNIGAFMDQKVEQHETVRNWSEQTRYKTRQVTLKLLVEADLLKRMNNSYLITPLPISEKLRHYAEITASV